MSSSMGDTAVLQPPEGTPSLGRPLSFSANGGADVNNNEGPAPNGEESSTQVAKTEHTVEDVIERSLVLQDLLDEFAKEPEEKEGDPMSPVLDLSYERCNIADFGLVCEGIAVTRTLAVLELAGMELDVRHASILCDALSQSGLIQYLDISCNRFGDDGLEKLAPTLSQLKLLNHLSLHHNEITNEGAGFVATIAANRAIRTLQIHGNPFLKSTGGDGRIAVQRAIADRYDLSCDHFVSPNVVEGHVLEKDEVKWRKTVLRTRLGKVSEPQMKLFQIIAKGSKKSLAKFMKENGKMVDLKAFHPEGFNVNHIAAANGHSALLKELIKMGVPVLEKTMDTLGGHPTWFTSGSGRLIHYALARRSTAMFFAVCAGSSKCVKILAGAGDKAIEPNASFLFAQDFARPGVIGVPKVSRETSLKNELNRITALRQTAMKLAMKKSGGGRKGKGAKKGGKGKKKKK